MLASWWHKLFLFSLPFILQLIWHPCINKTTWYQEGFGETVVICASENKQELVKALNSLELDE